MKGKVLALSILNFINSIISLIIIIQISKEISETINTNQSHYGNNYTTQAVNDLASNIAKFFFLFILSSGLGIAQLVIGIIVLSTLRNAKNRGICIASGIFGILSGIIFVGFIISTIAFIKERKITSNSLPQTDEQTNE